MIKITGPIEAYLRGEKEDSLEANGKRASWLALFCIYRVNFDYIELNFKYLNNHKNKLGHHANFPLFDFTHADWIPESFTDTKRQGIAS